ncbi:butyrate kinase [bacterium]|nr:butyrate kinase [bacterium]
MNDYVILALNPGSTSTKIALYKNDTLVWDESIDYGSEELNRFERIVDQLEMRKRDIEAVLREHGTDVRSLAAVVGRGGPFKPLESGTYRVDEALLSDIRQGNVQADHISNIGAVLADSLASQAGITAFFVDPVSVDEFIPLARYSGMPGLERRSLVHALNVKATARRAADALGKPLQSLNLVVAHLGGGISVCPLLKGRIIDVNNANEGGPFSPERTGSLPVSSLVKLCYSGEFTYADMKKKITRQGGLTAYLGVNDGRRIVARIEEGDDEAREVFEAMAYQIAKEIGAMATVLSGEVDAIVMTGGLAHQRMLLDWIEARVSFIAPMLVFPGENELEALALGALRVLRGEEEPRNY